MAESLSYQNLIEDAPIGVYKATLAPEVIYVNEALADLLDFESPDEIVGTESPVEFTDPEDEEVFLERVQEEGSVDTFETQLETNAGRTVDILLSGTLDDENMKGYVLDITDRKRLERKAEKQAEAILELSTPIVQIWEEITLATVVGTLDTERAQRLTEELLTELTESESEIALIDITGVPTIDTATAQHLIDTVNSVSLLGSEVIITGINPEIAQTLVQLNITMDDIRTRSSLSEGLELGLQIIDDANTVDSPFN